jgi:DNA-binding transcriptional LysR family regulator
MPVSQSTLIRSRLKIRQIVLLVHLDEQRSVLRAAEAAGMTQPAASKLLGELEEALGVALFERHARGVEPTWYGEILVRHARAALAELRRAHDEIEALRSGLAGKASIGTVVTPGTRLVPQAVALLKERHPRILVRIDLDHSEALVARLLAGELDMAVARIRDAQGAGDLDFEPLGDEPQSVIARADHPFARRRGLGVKDLARQAWVLPPAGSALRDELDAMFLEQGLDPPTNIVEASSLLVVISLLTSTDMVVSLPKESVRPYCEAGVLTVLPVALNVRMESFGIVTRRGRRLSPGAEALLEVLRETAARLYSRRLPERVRPRARTAAS